MPAKALPALPDPFTFAQARAAGLTKYALYQLRDSRKIEAIGHGIYRRAASKPAEEDLLEIVMRAPRATLCLATALVHHGLSDMIPPARDVALPRGTRAPATRAIVQWHYFDPSTFDLGRTTLRVGAHLEIGLYSSERSIVDAFRTRGQSLPTRRFAVGCVSAARPQHACLPSPRTSPARSLPSALRCRSSCEALPRHPRGSATLVGVGGGLKMGSRPGHARLAIALLLGVMALLMLGQCSEAVRWPDAGSAGSDAGAFADVWILPDAASSDAGGSSPDVGAFLDAAGSDAGPGLDAAGSCNPPCEGATPDCIGGRCVCNSYSCPNPTCGCSNGTCVMTTCCPSCYGEMPDCVGSVCKCNPASCRPGMVCQNGGCHLPECDAGCPGGQVCLSADASTACAPHQCDPPCRATTPDCDLTNHCVCNSASCPAGEYCAAGTCGPPHCDAWCAGTTPECSGPMGWCRCTSSSCVDGKVCDGRFCVLPTPDAGAADGSN